MNKLWSNSAFIKARFLANKVVLAMALASCSQSTFPSAQACLPPPVQVAFPLTDMPENISTPAPIPSNWEPQLSAEQVQAFNLTYLTSVIAKSSDEIWLTGGNYPLMLLRYQPSSHRIFTYTVEAFQGATYTPIQLFLSKHGELWGLGTGNHSTVELDNYHWFLSKYDAQKDQFSPVYDKTGILTSVYSDISAGEDSQGNLWFVVDNALIRFDPVSQEAERVLDRQQGITLYSLAIASDGKIWLTALVSQDAWQVVQYDPSTRELIRYGSPPNADPLYPAPLFFDHTGRLWIGNIAWLEVSSSDQAVWYEVIRPSIFVAKYGFEGGTRYGWSHPYRIYESSNGFLWFSSGKLVTFDSKTSEWCLVNDFGIIVSEDADHNLWIAGDGQIYKYHLEP